MPRCVTHSAGLRLRLGARGLSGLLCEGPVAVQLRPVGRHWHAN